MTPDLLKRIRDLAYNPRFHSESRNGLLVVMRVSSLQSLLEMLDQNAQVILDIDRRFVHMSMTQDQLAAALQALAGAMPAVVTGIQTLEQEIANESAAGQPVAQNVQDAFTAVQTAFAAVQNALPAAVTAPAGVPSGTVNVQGPPPTITQTNNPPADAPAPPADTPATPTAP